MYRKIIWISLPILIWLIYIVNSQCPPSRSHPQKTIQSSTSLTTPQSAEHLSDTPYETHTAEKSAASVESIEQHDSSLTYITSPKPTSTPTHLPMPSPAPSLKPTATPTLQPAVSSPTPSPTSTPTTTPTVTPSPEPMISSSSIEPPVPSPKTIEVWIEEQGHWEKEWYTEWVYMCNECSATFSTTDDFYAHVIPLVESEMHVIGSYTQVSSDPIYTGEEYWVVDVEGHYETITLE